MEMESSEWQLQGQPTVLLTLAHIFHHFAPLLVRRWQERAEGAMPGVSVLDACIFRGLRCSVCYLLGFRVTTAHKPEGEHPGKEG